MFSTTPISALAVFNLLPIPPLDGYKVFGAILPNSLYYKLMGYERYIGLVFLMLVFFGGGILGNDSEGYPHGRSTW